MLMGYQHILTLIHFSQLLLPYSERLFIISRGDFPNHVNFLIDGVAIGLRDYEDGKDYNYFQVDKTNANIGLLEVLSRKKKYIATITSLTKVIQVRVDSAIVYELIMSDTSLLRRCTVSNDFEKSVNLKWELGYNIIDPVLVPIWSTLHRLHNSPVQKRIQTPPFFIQKSL
ncbi:hypothetical protein [Pseudogracilibacillus sp. SO30301A]|uniref:hypothetical protein n=1 Tax=Pseudogracilibacillus sp. SO30301A TaxID=3098291 RepID=UPI00300E6CD6